MEVFLAVIAIPVMLCISIGIAYLLIAGIFKLMLHLDDWNRSDHC